jgi:hypothetical protein
MLSVLVFFQYTAFSGKRSFDQLQEEDRPREEVHQDHRVDPPRVTLPPLATAVESNVQRSRPFGMGVAVVGMAALMLFAGGFAVFSLLQSPNEDEDDDSGESGHELT